MAGATPANALESQGEIDVVKPAKKLKNKKKAHLSAEPEPANVVESKAEVDVVKPAKKLKKNEPTTVSPLDLHLMSIGAIAIKAPDAQKVVTQREEGDVDASGPTKNRKSKIRKVLEETLSTNMRMIRASTNLGRSKYMNKHDMWAIRFLPWRFDISLFQYASE